MARVLLIGGTRFIGRGITLAARAAGHTVAVFHRGQTGDQLPVEHLTGDRDRLPDHADALRAWRPDVVIHTIAFTEAHAADLIAVFAPLAPRTIVLSSMDRYELFQRVRADQEFGDFPVDEDDPRSATQHYYRGSPYPWAQDYDKNLVTDAVLAAGRAGDLRPTVLHLPMVYGPRDANFAGRHGEVIHHLLDGQRRYVIGAMGQGDIWTFGFVDNVAAAIVACIDAPATVGLDLNIGEARVRSKRRWASLYAEAAGQSLEFCPVPDALLDPGHVDHAPASHLILSSARFRRLTGFVDPVSIPDAVAETLSWARSHREALGDPPDYAGRLAAWTAWGEMRPVKA